jgi:signal transduction histidine kinase
MVEAAESKPVVLVVDDNEQNRELARATLESEDFDVELASSGEQAIVSFAQRCPDCVLLDIRMPVMDGIETCKRLRALPGAENVPILFVTASRDVDAFDAAQAAGGSDFLTKPVQPTELLLRVQTALRLRRLDASNQEYFELVRRQRDDLMRLQLQKERLSSFVVHDLKNPVASIDLSAQLLQRDKRLPADARETADSIRVEVALLMRLILNLLDINKSEEGELSTSIAKLDLAALASGTIDGLQARARARQVTLAAELGGLTSVNADADLLRRVLENLIDNALRYAPKGSVVTLSAREQPGVVELRIADQGKGVPEELRETIFERYVQLSGGDRSTHRTGHGLGLTFCRLAVEAQGGSIHVESGEPGAVFCIRLPRADG